MRPILLLAGCCRILQEDAKRRCAVRDNQACGTDAKKCKIYKRARAMDSKNIFLQLNLTSSPLQEDDRARSWT